MKRKVFFFIWLWAFLLLGAGYYLTLNNLGFLLNESGPGGGFPGVKWIWQKGELIINCGSWHEAVTLDFWPSIGRKQ
ncbi:MAG TPA: hypothetical protein VF531_02920 [Bacillota bacterium]